MRSNMHKFDMTMGEKRLSKLIAEVQKHIDNGPGVDTSCIEQLENYKKQIEYMRMYAGAEKKDPYRQKVFDDMVAGLLVLQRDVIKCSRIELSPELRAMKKRAPEADFEISSIRRRLEDYVSDVAMAGLPGGGDENQIIDEHFAYVEKLFDYIITGRLWNETKKTFFADILSSPVIDSNDALVLVSAISLSTLLVSDGYKIEALIDIYTSATNAEVKERALVGWVLALHSIGGASWRLHEKVDALVKQTSVMEDLLELQMQIIYCTEAEKDTDKIQRDIMPGIVNNQNIKLNRFGIIDKDDDAMNDILGSSSDADKAMEDIEKSMDKIKEMQKKGADIYFGGFAKMKRFAFFTPMVNWFYPYYHKHPALRSVIEKMKGSRLLETMVGNCPFCNSDKYSFALAMSSIYDQLPDEIKNVLGSEEMFKMEMADSNAGTPSYMRRIYLQDLYRFFKLNSSSRSMDNPFEEEEGLMRGFFFDDEFLKCNEMIQAKQSLARFFMKKRPQGEELQLLFLSYESEDTNDILTRAKYLQSRGTAEDMRQALKKYSYVYQKSGETNDAALSGMTRCLSHMGQYEQACAYSDILAEKYPDDYNHQLSHAILLIKCDRAGEANNILFKLNYERPDDRNVMRVLAWCLLMEDKTDKALGMFDRIATTGKLTAEDRLNMGFARWVAGSVSDAADCFSKYVETEGIGALEHEIEEETQFLNAHDIIEVDMCMMLDLAEERTKQA